MEEDIKQIKSSLKELETERDDIQIRCIEAELELSIENILNELERLQKENNDLRAIKETVRYLEEEGEKDDLYYVVGRGTYLADVLNSAFNDYIPKQVIRDKIKEVNKEYKKYTEKWEKSGMNKEHPFYRYIVRLEAQIDILKEILGDE